MGYRPGKSNTNANALTRMHRDLPDWGDKSLTNLDLVVLKWQNLLQQLYLLADSPPRQGLHSISDLLESAILTDLLPGTNMEPMRTNGTIKDIMIAQCS